MGLSHSPKIPTSGLILCLDAANAKSYPGSGTTWTDLSGKGNHHTLVDTPTFSTDKFTLNGTSEGFQQLTALTGVTSTCTVVMWYSTTEQQELWAVGQTTSYYFSASNNNNYYESNAGSPTNYVDLVSVTNPYAAGLKDGAYHMWEAKTVDLTTWTAIKWGLYGGAWNLGGDVSMVLVYDRVITVGESLQIYNAMRGRHGI